MVKFEVRTADTLDGQVAYRFDVGIVDEFQVACEMIPPDAVMTKEHLVRVLFQLANHLSDNRYLNSQLESAKLVSDLLEENATLKKLFETRE